MQFLTYELAQEIVGRTMKILNQNINVMNEEGVIIGSGERDRIDQLHTGALLVLEKGESMEIDDASAAEMKGARPGINLPILFNDQVVGVIGITGEPEQIRNYAQLVKMAAELVLEQSFLLERVQWKQRLQSEIVNQLIAEGDLNEESIKQRAGFLGMDVGCPRFAIVMEKMDDAQITTQGLIGAVQYEIGRNDLIGVSYNEEIVVLKAAGSKWGLNHFLERLQKISSENVRMGIGRVANQLNQLKASFSQAKNAIMVGSKLDPDRNCFPYEKYQLEIMLSKVIREEDKSAFSYYDNLLDQGRKGELIDTLEAYIREGGELNKIAESLFIHRNTLRYRLDKIAELTGKDPRDAKDLMELYMAKLQRDLS
ncbi:CdaR family transcriptional regulator [Terribacillus halophilus]|uniref:CdaR family transcriptional regulator n=1 Tax=Terribacillus halophilus TaxID=361279 RepID=UPI003982A32A